LLYPTELQARSVIIAARRAAFNRGGRPERARGRRDGVPRGVLIYNGADLRDVATTPWGDARVPVQAPRTSLRRPAGAAFPRTRVPGVTRAAA
jgi:hypothetical protein